MARAPRLRLAVAVCAVLVASSVADPPQDAERITLSIPTAGPALRLAGPGPPRAAYETDVLRVARVFHELGLPLPERITLELYPSSELLARGITEHAGFAPDLASVVGRFAAGIAVDETLLVLEPEFRRGPRAWLRLLAHEMAHLAQIELGGGAQCRPRWLVEGMAEWVAFTALDRLGVSRMSAEQEVILAHARRDMTTGLRVDLDQIDGSRGFLRYAEKVGVGPVYRLAFFLAHRLVERGGLGALVEYFRACSARTDQRASFEQIFELRLEDFEREMVQAWASRLPGTSWNCTVERSRPRAVDSGTGRHSPCAFPSPPERRQRHRRPVREFSFRSHHGFIFVPHPGCEARSQDAGGDRCSG